MQTWVQPETTCFGREAELMVSSLQVSSTAARWTHLQLSCALRAEQGASMQKRAWREARGHTDGIKVGHQMTPGGLCSHPTHISQPS